MMKREDEKIDRGMKAEDAIPEMAEQWEKGSKTELVAVRVPKVMFEAIKKRASARKTTIPTYVRIVLLEDTFPYCLLELEDAKWFVGDMEIEMRGERAGSFTFDVFLDNLEIKLKRGKEVVRELEKRIDEIKQMRSGFIATVKARLSALDKKINSIMKKE